MNGLAAPGQKKRTGTKKRKRDKRSKHVGDKIQNAFGTNKTQTGQKKNIGQKNIMIFEKMTNGKKTWSESAGGGGKVGAQTWLKGRGLKVRGRRWVPKGGGPKVAAPIWHDSPRAQTCTLEVPAFKKHHQNSTRRPQRDTERAKRWREREEKERNFWRSGGGRSGRGRSGRGRSRRGRSRRGGSEEGGPVEGGENAQTQHTHNNTHTQHTTHTTTQNNTHNTKHTHKHTQTHIPMSFFCPEFGFLICPNVVFYFVRVSVFFLSRCVFLSRYQTDSSRCHKRRALREATQRDSLEGIAVHLSPDCRPPAIWVEWNAQIGLVQGGCRDENCILGAHKRPPNTLGLEENHILLWNTEDGSCALGICDCCNEIAETAGALWWDSASHLDGDKNDPNSHNGLGKTAHNILRGLLCHILDVCTPASACHLTQRHWNRGENCHGTVCNRCRHADRCGSSNWHPRHQHCDLRPKVRDFLAESCQMTLVLLMLHTSIN